MIMKHFISRGQDDIAQPLTRLGGLLLAGAMMILIAGCDVEDSGEVRNSIDLPTDSQLNFACENEGVFPDDCVLDNADNPYVTVNVTDATKFQLNDDAPSAKSRYYLWATALARQPMGENQYYTAVSLHEVFAESGSPTTRDQAIKAYRSVLDNFFNSATFFVVPVSSGDVAFAVALKDIVGQNLYDPEANSLVPLFSDPLFALQAISEWGYIYEPPLTDALEDNGTMSFFD